MSIPIVKQKKSKLIVPEIGEVKVGLDGSKVVIYTKDAVIKIPWQVSTVLAKAIHAKGKQAEEMANLPRLLSDQALMFRTGAPFGLSNNPDILKEAAHKAQFDRELRKLPGGVKSTALVGTPRIIKHRPKKEVKK